MNVKEIILKVSAYNKQIEEQLEDFTTGCYTLKETSAGKYQVQKTTLLNKIYLQGYILDSKLCRQFKANNITNYSLTNLRDYITKNYNNLDTDYTSYYQALSLYEKANNLEELIDDKIELEIDLLSNYEKDIERIAGCSDGNHRGPSGLRDRHRRLGGCDQREPDVGLFPPRVRGCGSYLLRRLRNDPEPGRHQGNHPVPGVDHRYRGRVVLLLGRPHGEHCRPPEQRVLRPR
mgnify:CR=1 FL=1